MSRYMLICCEVLYREACFLLSSTPHTIDAVYLPKGLHDDGGDAMRKELQSHIDAVDSSIYDAVLMGYGLCNNGLSGIVARDLPVVIPRAHDCITLFLGSRERYREQFDAHPGTYYRTSGWIERGKTDDSIQAALGGQLKYDELVAQYGRDNADYVMETLGNQLEHYDRLAFIRMGLDGEDHFAQATQREAAERELRYEELPGALTIIRDLIHGRWDSDMLVLQPGQQAAASHDPDVLRAE